MEYKEKRQACWLLTVNIWYEHNISVAHRIYKTIQAMVEKGIQWERTLYMQSLLSVVDTMP